MFFECGLKSERIDHGREHTHLVTSGPVNSLLFRPEAAVDVTAAYNDTDLDSQVAYLLNFFRKKIKYFGINPCPLPPIKDSPLSFSSIRLYLSSISIKTV